MGDFIHVTADRSCVYFLAPGRPYRLAVRTPPFHGGGTGSIPVRVAIISPIIIRIRILNSHFGRGSPAPCHFFNFFERICAVDLYKCETIRL